MKHLRLKKFAIATTTIALATLFSAGWSVDSAQARARLYVTSGYYHHPYDPYRVDPSLSWYAVRAYYLGGPWSGVGGSGVPYSYAGWSDYASQNGIGCTPGTILHGGDGIDYVCQ